jgi:hypothetical protein
MSYAKVDFSHLNPVAKRLTGTDNNLPEDDTVVSKHVGAV